MQAEIICVGRVFTADPSHPWAEAVAIADGTVCAVGTRGEVGETAGGHTRIIDAGDGLILPGMCDAHMHLSQGAVASMFQVDLAGASSPEEYLDRISTFTAAHPGRPSYQGYGWDDAVFAAEGVVPDRTFLDLACPDVPLAIRSYDGHSLVANTAALELAGIGRGYVSARPGELVCDATGRPTGLFREWTMRDVMDTLGPYSIADYRAAIVEEQQKFLKVGVTSVYEPIIDSGDAVRAAYLDLDRAGELVLKVSTGFYARPEADGCDDMVAFAQRTSDLGAGASAGRVRFGNVKILLDGVVEGETAFLGSDYTDRPGWRGEALCTPAQLEEALLTACDLGFQVHMHAIGDAAVAMALDGLEAVSGERPRPDWRPTITHLQLLAPRDIERMAALGVVASTNPVWHEKEPGYFGELARPRLGDARAEREYPLHDLMRAGIPVSMGTDYPVSDPDPLLGIEVGVTRSMPGDEAGETCLWPEQRATVEEMLMAATAGGAYQTFQERRSGSLKPGLAADLCILDRDITRVDPWHIHEARCVLTMVDGAVVWRDPGGGLAA